MLHAGQKGTRGCVGRWAFFIGRQCAHGHQIGRGRRCAVEPLRQQLGPEKSKYTARAGLRVQTIGELGFDPGGLKQKRQRPAPGRQGCRQALGIALRLNFNPFEGDAFFFGLDHATGFAVHIQQVVCKAMARVEREFTNGHAQCGMQIDLIDIANMPAR